MTHRLVTRRAAASNIISAPFTLTGPLSEILRLNANGQAATREMERTTRSSEPGFDGDGHSHIPRQNADGRTAIWEMSGTNQIAGGGQPADPQS